MITVVSMNKPLYTKRSHESTSLYLLLCFIYFFHSVTFLSYVHIEKEIHGQENVMINVSYVGLLVDYANGIICTSLYLEDE